jgi:hypothetical protein
MLGASSETIILLEVTKLPNYFNLTAKLEMCFESDKDFEFGNQSTELI